MGDLLRRTAFKVGLVVVVVCLVAGYVLSRIWPGNPDPGGRIMTALSTIQVAVPAQAHLVRVEHVKPRWDSCDARLSTFGWDDAFVYLTFTTSEPPRSLMATASARLRAAGWSRYQGLASGPGFGWWWSLPVPGGTALALLDRQAPGQVSRSGSWLRTRRRSPARDRRGADGQPPLPTTAGSYRPWQRTIGVPISRKLWSVSTCLATPSWNSTMMSEPPNWK